MLTLKQEPEPIEWMNPLLGAEIMPKPPNDNGIISPTAPMPNTYRVGCSMDPSSIGCICRCSQAW